MKKTKRIVRNRRKMEKSLRGLDKTIETAIPFVNGKKDAENRFLWHLRLLKAFAHHPMAAFDKKGLLIGRSEAPGIIIPDHLCINEINDSAGDRIVGYHVGTPFHAGSCA